MWLEEERFEPIIDVAGSVSYLCPSDNILVAVIEFRTCQAMSYCNNSIELMVFSPYTEHSRVQLAEGTLVDIFCSLYSVSCKVLHNLYHYFYQQEDQSWYGAAR